MRILHVIASMDPKMGGVSMAVSMMTNGLNRYEIQSEVVTLDPNNAPYLENNSFPIHAVGPGKSAWQYSNKLIPWLITNFSRFDTIIIHGLWLYNGYAVEKAMRIFKKKYQDATRDVSKNPKVFVMPHGMLDPYFQQAAGRKLKALRNWAYWKLIERKVVNRSEGLLFTSEEEKQLAKKSFYPYFPKRESVVSLGIEAPPQYHTDMQSAFLKHCPALQNSPYLLFLARIHEKKGLDLLIKAYMDVYGEATANFVLDSSNADSFFKTTIPRLVVAGPNLDSLYGIAMQKIVAQNAVLKNMIYFTGMLSGDAKWGALYGCEGFILPSHQENFGIAIVEALACGKPVLISNQVNIWREIEAAECGIVENDDQEGTKRMLKTWNHLLPGKKIQMGQNAHNFFENTFSIDATVKKLATAVSLGQ